MKRKHALKIEMFNAVQEHLTRNTEIWAGIEQLNHAVRILSNNNTELNELKEKQEQDLSHLIDQKSERRTSLVNSALPVIKILQAFAHDRDNKETIRKSDFSRNKFSKSKDLDVVEKSKFILKTAEKVYQKSLDNAEAVDLKLKENPVNISTYGLTGKMLTHLGDDIKAFVDAHLALRNAIEEKRKAGKLISDFIPENEVILKKKIDLLVSIFETAHPEFYSSFKQKRKAFKTDKIPKNTKNEILETAGNDEFQANSSL